MNVSNEDKIKLTIHFVKLKLKNVEAGHDWFHVKRVWKLALKIAQKENKKATELDFLVIELAALLHDIADPKFHNGDEKLAIHIASDFLNDIGVSPFQQNHILDIIKNLSFKNKDEVAIHSKSLEFKIVQDADRLDAIGAIGIARAFNFGGYKNNLIFHPAIPPRLMMDKETYKKSDGTTINHFYEKLLLLKDKMNTEEAKRIAVKRHQFMLTFLEEFDKEWNLNL